ncbi:MAG: type VI secretion system baseplate subunit TssG [Myxococcota bacterium]
MERGNRDSDRSLKAYVDAAPRGSFFALLSFLERATRGSGRLGGTVAAAELIRLRHDPSTSFPAADVVSLALDPDSASRIEVLCTFLGLSGSGSPLPVEMAQEVLDDSLDDGVLKDFLDLFHHRLYSLLYRGVVALDPAREYRTDASDPWLLRVLALAGVDRPDSLSLEPNHLMRLVPVLVRRSRGAEALRVALRSLLDLEMPGVTVSIRELVGGFFELEADQCTRLGVDNHALARTTVLGRRVHDRRGRFAVVIGTLSSDQARRFEEPSQLLDQIRDVVKLVVRDPLAYDVELILEQGAIAPFQLGRSRLGAARLRGFEQEETTVLRDVGTKSSATRSLM